MGGGPTLFGRAAELRELERLFERSRLVTIVGLGGIGKTRLAAAHATARIVRLAEARTLEEAVRVIALAEGVPITSESRARDALGALAKSLRPGLLVLDNTEQLGAAALTLVSGLLDGTELRLLVTSREPTGARDEEKLVLAPLAEAEAIALFLDRARTATGSAASVDEADARAIVRRVDAIPLAIELAAARLEVLSPAALLARLDRIDVLASRGGADARATHDDARRTMRATLEWSWELLSESERSALTQASVFAGPFTIDAAEDVFVLAEDEVLDVLERLVQRSLLTRVADAGAGVRLAMFDTVRRWARERADRSAIDRHARYHLAKAERAATETYGETGAAALDCLEALLPELLAALREVEESDPLTAARIVLALADVLLFRGLLELRAELASIGVAAAERTGNRYLLARARVVKARVALEEGRIDDAERDLRSALAEGDEVTRGEAWRSLGWALGALGRGADAEAALAEAERVHRTHGHARGLADVEVARGILRSFEGRRADSLQHLRAALFIHAEHGDAVRQAKVLGFGALVGHDPRELARGLARDVIARAPKDFDVATHGAQGDNAKDDVATRGVHWQDAIAIHRQGSRAYERGDMEAAVASFDRAAAILERAGVKRGVPWIHAHAAVALVAIDLADAHARLERARRAAIADPAALRVVDVYAAAIDVLGGGDVAAARALHDAAFRAEIATPELVQAARILGDVLAGRRVESAEIVVGPEARFIVLASGRIDLGRYGPVRRLFDRLVVSRLEQPGRSLSAEALIEAGWPGERMRHSAGLLRVYSAIRRLRKLGLDHAIATRDDGYLIAPDVVVRRVES